VINILPVQHDSLKLHSALS